MKVGSERLENECWGEEEEWHMGKKNVEARHKKGARGKSGERASDYADVQERWRYTV